MPGDLRQALQEATAGEYEIHHELGRGGMGSVFLAREIGLDRLVAIKVLPPTLMFDPGLIERFQREARLVAKLHHPHIIPVYRVHHSHNLVFYTMHFVPGRSLGEVIGSGRVMPVGEVEHLMLEAAAGLGYAHKRGVIHRDVKPANILLDVEGHVHLTDFGIAKALVGSTHLTDTGALIGTPQYMAPEQCEGRMVDGRADQYSLAAVGYQMLVGHPPFESVSVKELLYHHLFTPPRALNNLRPDIPPPLRDSVHKALSKDPADRFDSMEDFKAAVEGKGPPVFVKWLDDPRERWRTPPGGVALRRSTDLPTPRSISQANWSSSHAVQRAEPPLYRKVAGAVMVALVTVSIVGVLALSQDGDLREKLQSRWGGATSAETGGSTGPDQMVLGSNGEALEERDAATSTVPSPETGDPAAGERSEAVDSIATLAIQGALPVDARWWIDGEEQLRLPRDGMLKGLPPGLHTIEIRASGYQVWSDEIDLRPGDTHAIAPQLAPLATRQEPPRTAARSESTVRRPQSASTPAPPPEVPEELLSELHKLMGEGRQFFDIAAYQDAIDTYADVINRALEARAKYAQSDDLDSLRLLAESRQEEARRVCRDKGLTCL